MKDVCLLYASKVAEGFDHKHSAGPGFRPDTISESMANAMLLLLARHLQK